MKLQKQLGGILAAVICLLSVGSITVQAEESWPKGPEVQAESAVVMEAETGTILYEKNPHEQLYPASITKIMTTLLAIENCSLDEEVTFSHDAIYNIERDSTHIARDVGEIMTMEQCLYAVMLGSANECAYAVGEHTGNGYENFISMMNEKAAELGCTDTHFNNPHGLTDPDHYTSAYDMALISRAALENETFRRITSTKKYTIPFTNKHPDEETYLVNHHKMLTNYNGDSKYLYDYCIGGKTGYTEAARYTLVTFARKDDMTLICVVMKDSSGVQYQDTRALLDYCFDNFSMWSVLENEPEYTVSGTANTELLESGGNIVQLDPESRIILPNTASFEDAAYEIVEGEAADGTVAVLDYSYEGRTVGSAEIRRIAAAVEPYSFHTLEEERESVPEEKHFIEINTRYILVGVLVVLILAALIFLIYYFASNFYLLRHRIHSRKRQKSRFKTIKNGKHSRWKSRW